MRGAPCELRMLPELHSWTSEATDLREGCALRFPDPEALLARIHNTGIITVWISGPRLAGDSGAEEELALGATHQMWKALPAFRIAGRRAS